MGIRGWRRRVRGRASGRSSNGGTCVATPANEGGGCDDGTGCTVDDVCGVGVCAGAPAPETVGDGIDADCDTMVDCYADVDGDGFRSDLVVASVDADCTDAGEALLTAALDCDDSNGAVSPAAVEACDTANLDENCDGLADDATATGQSSFYADADADTFGDAATTTMSCDAPEGFVTDATDCDDANAAAFPAATEVMDDGIDQDCDGEDSVTPQDTGTDDTASDTGIADTATDSGTDVVTDDTAEGDHDEKGGCGCSSPGAPQGSALLVALAASALVRRRARQA